MSFLNGVGGIVAGAILFVVAALFFASSQYIYPTQAAFWMWVAVIGIVIMLGSPVWFWLIDPLRRRGSSD